MDKFAFTIKDNRKDQHDYNLVFNLWATHGCVVLCKYAERDTRGVVHYHGIVNIPHNLYRKQLCPYGYHVKLKEMFDEDGWTTYCKKDQEEESLDTDDNSCMEYLLKNKIRLV